MTSTNRDTQVGGYRREVDYQKLGPALLIASSLILAINGPLDGLPHITTAFRTWTGKRRWNTVCVLQRSFCRI